MAKSNSSKWSYSLLVDIYILAKTGMSNVQITKALGITNPTWLKWKEKYPEIKDSLRKARDATTDGGTAESFEQYVYRHLSTELKPLWDKLVTLKEEKTLSIEKIEDLLGGRGRQTRQRLFVHALVHSAFSTSKALEMVGVSKKRLDKWVEEDLGFRELLEEIQWHKKNFFEDQMLMLVKMGNPAAIIHANKSQNADRGYGDKLHIEGNVNHTHTHFLVDVSKLKTLDVETLEKIEKAIEVAEKEQKALPAPDADNKAA